MPLRLSFETGALAGIHIVTSAPKIRLGRDPQTNDILLTNPKVSRKHAVIERSVRGGYSLEVLGIGPSLLNGDPVAAVGGRPTVHTLATGDRLAFGGVELIVSEATVKLIAVSGPSAGRELVLDGSVRIGSGHDCEFVLNDRSVLAEHLVIVSTPLGFRAEPRGPSLFNGQPGEPRVLSHGDELVLGTTALRFVAQAAEDAGADASMSTSFTAGTVTDAVGELIVIAGPSKGERIPLGNEQIILGTRGDCSAVLSDILASPLHCAISKSGDQFVATDLGSESGTFVNGARITQGTVLAPGDLIAIGIHVLETRMIGGVTVATKGSTMFTTLAAAGAEGPQPRFVIESRVVSAPRIVIGRAPTCDVIIDHPSVSREHCAIEWADGFTVRDTSTGGTYVDDKRIVRQQLPPSAVLRILDTLFRIAIRGEVCTIERADAALAQAALDVARAHASLLTRGMQAAEAGGVQLQPMRTLYRMDVGALEQEIAARKKDLRRGAPAWRPSSDLATNRPMRGAVVLSVLAAIALCGGAVVFGRGESLVNHPLSEAHTITAFTGKATGTTVCGACHTSATRIDSARCAGCHAGFAARPAHHALACDGCHVEHRGAAADHALHATTSCASCHPRQHAADFAPAGSVPQRLAAKPLTKQLDTAALHVAHTRVAIDGAPTGIGCTACHAKLAAAGAATPATGAALVQAVPGLACFRCHPGGAEASITGCAQCHHTEHRAPLDRLPAGAPGRVIALTMPNPLGSVGWAFAIALVGGTPGLLFGGWLRVRRRRTASAMVDDLHAHPAEVVKRLVHSINDSKCVGCNLCVQACPASVLELVDHKSRVVNFDSCIQCKKCESACAFDALRMHDADKPPPMIPMPSIDAFHETPVAGMYLIGQASGTPQVKNATNLGRAVVQRMVQQGVLPGLGAQLGCNVDVAIVGSGPAGLSAALTCIELGLSYVVLEKERAFSWTIRNYYHKGKEVMAEPHDIALEATLPHWDTSREELLGAWQQLVDQHRVDIRYQHSVLDVKPDAGRFALSLGDPKDKPIGTVTAARVVIAIGTLGNPRKLGCAGDELEKVKNSLVDPDEWIGKNILIVGGSDSAVEVVLALSAPERRNQVWFSTRGAKLEGIKPKNRKLIEDALAARRFQIRYATQVAEVSPQSLVLTYKEDGRREELPNDVVFAMIGGNSPQKWLQQIGIPYVDKPHSWSPPRTDLIAQKTAEGLISVHRLVRGTLGLR
jgi:pSer/pThr/pTyr-binding forkhead associated (FHA) protein/thioredoxin reductase/ferredoxin